MPGGTYDLYQKKISATYHRILQYESSSVKLLDGRGDEITTVISASVLSASSALWSISSSFADRSISSSTALFALTSEDGKWTGSNGFISRYSDTQISGNLYVSNSFALSAGVSVDGISNDTTLVDSSQTSIVTEHAVKVYIDNQIIVVSSGSIFGTGSEGYIPRWNNSYSLDDSVIYQDNIKVSINRDVEISGSLYVTGSIYGTSSVALSSSTAYSASSAWWSISSSYAQTASQALSSSDALYSISASSALWSVSSSFADKSLSGSSALWSISSSYTVTASSALSASSALWTLSASYAQNATILRYSFLNITSTYLSNIDDQVLVCSGTFTVTLPFMTGSSGKFIHVKCSAGTITVSGSLGDTIDDLCTQTVQSPNSMMVVGDGSTKWYII